MFAIRDTTIMILFYFVLRWGSKRRPAHSNSHVSSLPGTVLYVPGTVRFVRVIRVPACARVSRVSRVCPGSPRCLFTGDCSRNKSSHELFPRNSL